MSVVEGRQSNAQLRRLQALLLFMLLWDLLAVLASLSFGSALMRVEGTEIGGLLAAKASFSGAGLIPVSIYFYGIIRNPIRHPGVLWVGVVEQGAAILASLYAVVGNDVKLEGAIATVVISVIFLALLLVNMPRGDARG